MNHRNNDHFLLFSFHSLLSPLSIFHSVHILFLSHSFLELLHEEFSPSRKEQVFDAVFPDFPDSRRRQFCRASSFARWRLVFLFEFFSLYLFGVADLKRVLSTGGANLLTQELGWVFPVHTPSPSLIMQPEERRRAKWKSTAGGLPCQIKMRQHTQPRCTYMAAVGWTMSSSTSVSVSLAERRFKNGWKVQTVPLFELEGLNQKLETKYHRPLHV